jgi:hypothetical protein
METRISFHIPIILFSSPPPPTFLCLSLSSYVNLSVALMLFVPIRATVMGVSYLTLCFSIRYFSNLDLGTEICDLYPLRTRIDYEVTTQVSCSLILTVF